ncbi:MAG: ABC transporter permease [Clostridiales bacterium]|jgi:simple sugar transport system permease protein|nr:ABC transporter permease [Clostridiales bacterium]
MDYFLSFIAAVILAGTPILFGTVGEIINEKAGNLNLGVEGMMALGACAGFMAGYLLGNPALAIAASFLAGAAGALIYAVLTVTFMANQTVVGLTLTIFGVGFSNFTGEYMLTHSANNTLKIPENVMRALGGLNIQGLSALPIAGKILFSYNIFVYLGIAVAIIAGYYLKRTKIGLSVRAIGENPAAADAAGIKVAPLKYLNIVVGGGICGIGGAYASIITCGGVWMSNSVNGLGWIAVALVIFASWNPIKAILGSYVFGAFSILKYYVPKSYIPAPNAFYDMLPFLVTALILVIASIRDSKENSQPAGCGINYFREER